MFQVRNPTSIEYSVHFYHRYDNRLFLVYDDPCPTKPIVYFQQKTTFRHIGLSVFLSIFLNIDAPWDFLVFPIDITLQPTL